MKKKRLAIVNGFLFLAILLFVLVYVSVYRRDYADAQKKSFEDMAVAVEQIAENYLLSEQRICDVWAEYIDEAAFDMEQAMAFLEQSQIRDEYSCQILYMDRSYPYGYSTSKNRISKEQAVSYQRIQLFSDYEKVRESASNELSVTRAFTDPITGLQTIGFYNLIHLTEDGEVKECLLLRMVPVSELQKKWNFKTEQYKSADYAVIDNTGNYIIKGPNYKNNNFFEFYRSYNHEAKDQVGALKGSMEQGSGSFEMKDGTGEQVFMAYAPIKQTDEWKLVTGVYLKEITEIDLHLNLLLVVALSLVIILIYDMAAIYAVNRQLEKSAAEAEKANRAKSDFLSSMSHDIRTPMNAIIGMTTIARKNVTDPTKVSECLDKISLANGHLLNLINDILDISKIESGKIELADADFSLGDLMQNIINVAQSQAEAKQIRLEIKQHIETDMLRGDALRLIQIYMNLVSNALKYTDEGGHVEINLKDEASPRGDAYMRVHWKVADNGIGMSEEFMQHMYSTFSRAEDTTVKKTEGTGLGLAIVKQLVDLMGGRIDVKSAPGEGTTFVVDLDLRKGASKPKAEALTAAAEDDSLAGTRILVAEDIEVNWEIINVLMADQRIHCDHAWDGAECVKMLENAAANSYDLVFMDVQMPNMNGLEATRAIRALDDRSKAEIPIIAMTANALSENIEECLNAGMNGHISKPIDIDRVLQEIRKIMEAKR